jgi:hypothetical protein
VISIQNLIYEAWHDMLGDDAPFLAFIKTYSLLT